MFENLWDYWKFISCSQYAFVYDWEKIIFLVIICLLGHLDKIRKLNYKDMNDDSILIH